MVLWVGYGLTRGPGHIMQFLVYICTAEVVTWKFIQSVSCPTKGTHRLIPVEEQVP